MAEYDVVGIVVQLAEGDVTAPLFHRVGAGNLEALRVSKDAGSFLLDQDALLLPGLEVACRAAIDAFAPLRIEKFRKAEDDAHQAVRAALVVSLLHGRGNLIIRLS